MKIMPARETVAGDATRRSSTSNKSDICGVSGMRSPLMSVKILLSSMTEFIDSIHMASTGPSKRIHASPGLSDSAHDLKIVDRMPSAHSKVARSYAPYNSVRVIDFELMRYDVTGAWPATPSRASLDLALASVFQAVDLPLKEAPTSMLQCLVSFESYSCPILKSRNGCGCRPFALRSASKAAPRSPISERGSSKDGNKSPSKRRKSRSSSLINFGKFMSLSARIKMASSLVAGSARLMAPAMLRTAFKFRNP
mmetsp:Transcript_17795/g.60097  ORF Transcript_17795/g.60097 Transcript_17795/m.60097 type:complete len:253 (+) Transcript_17795:1621-2379(+)